MREVQLTIARPHVAQRKVLAEQKRFNVLCCGRRWGKTTIAQHVIVPAVASGQKWAWFAPRLPLLEEPWEQLKRTLEPLTKGRDEQQRIIRCIGGGHLKCWSLHNDPDGGRGNPYHGVIIDEAAIVTNLGQAWEQTIRATLSDYRGSAWFLSTPKGVASYFHALYQRGKSEGDWASWQMPTTTNPYIDPAEVEAARGDMTDLAFAQEYEAQFVTWTGAVFRRIAEALMPLGSITAPCAMIGVDWGRTNDSTVFTALSQRGEVIDIDRLRGIPYAVQQDRLRQFWERHGKRSWIMAEVNSMGGPVVEALQRDGLPVIGFVTTGPSKAAIIESLALAFEQGTIKIPNDPVLIGELQAFEGVQTPRAMKYGAPAGLHDDCVMSLAFAWAGLVAPRAEELHMDPATGLYGAAPAVYEISPI